MDEDLSSLSLDEARAEISRLREGIRRHRDSSGHQLCWHHPGLWGLLPEPVPAQIAVPEWPQFLRGCIRYRQSLDAQLPNAPRTAGEFLPDAPGPSPVVKSRVWSSTLGSRPGLESLQWGRGWADGILQAFTPENGAFALRYRFSWDERWRVSRVKLECWHHSERREVELLLDADGRWRVDGRQEEALRGCEDFDLWPTPFTNTLALQRLGLEVGQRRQIDVAYCEAPTLTFRREVQAYERLAERRYRFESPRDGFSAVLEVDEETLVRVYPGLFVRTDEDGPGR